MREIKFRAFQKHGNRMEDWIAIDGYENDGLNNEIKKHQDRGDILMQFTGLKDKNGVEIYEGDIVKAWICYGPGGEVKQTFEIKIGTFGVNIEEWNYKENVLPEVIGNIYENPELLKGE